MAVFNFNYKLPHKVIYYITMTFSHLYFSLSPVLRNGSTSGPQLIKVSLCLNEINWYPQLMFHLTNKIPERIEYPNLETIEKSSRKSRNETFYTSEK